MKRQFKAWMREGRWEDYENKLSEGKKMKRQFNKMYWIGPILAVILLVGGLASRPIISAIVPSQEIYNVEIYSSISKESSKELNRILREAKKGDVINIYLNSPGGSVRSGIDTVFLFKTTKAEVNIKVGYLAASMAALWLLYADNVEIAPWAIVMYHTYQKPVGYGKNGIVYKPVLAKDAKTQAERAIVKQITYIFNDLKQFFTQKEIKDLLNGKEIWFTGEEVSKRLQTMKKTLQNKPLLPNWDHKFKALN